MSTIRPVLREQLLNGGAAGSAAVGEETPVGVGSSLSAASILYLCDGNRTVAEIATTLAEVAGCSVDELQGDIERTIRRLHAMNLIDLNIGPPPATS